MKMRGSMGWILGSVLATSACGSRYEVGMMSSAEDAGATSGSGGSNEGVTSGSGGSNEGMTSGSGGSNEGGSGGQAGTSAGVDAAPPPPRCSFTPEISGEGASIMASATVISSRIYAFLDGDPTGLPPGALPSQPTAVWAADRAMAILDGHLAAHTNAPGFIRFMKAWLGLSDVNALPAVTWSMKLLEPNATLATLLATPTGEPHRIGILTDRQWLQAKQRIVSRGMWVQNQLLCAPKFSIPASSPPTLPPKGDTRREKWENIVSPPDCQTCHAIMDPPGFALEHFDDTGNYSDLDNGKAINAAGTMISTDRTLQLAFTSIDDLAPQLATSCDVARCFARKVMTDAYSVSPGMMAVPLTESEVNHVANAFANSGFSIRELVKAVVRTPSFLR